MSDVLRFVHTADWQLGMRRHYLSDEAAARATEARFEAIARLGALAREHRAEAVLVAGDVFDSNHVDRTTVGRALDVLRELGLPVLLLPGNHDPLDGASIYRRADFRDACPSNVLVVEEPVALRPGVEVVPAPWRSKRPGRDLVAEACAGLPAADGGVRVLLAHGGVDVLTPQATDPERIALDGLEAALRDGRIAYAALGDRHSTTSVGSTGRIWYAGTPEVTDFDEVRPGRALLVAVDGGGCEVTELAVGSWTYRRELLDLSARDGVAELRTWLDDVVDKRRTVLRLALRGAVSVADRLEIDLLLDRAAERFACLDRDDDRTELVVVADDEQLDDLGLGGFARAAIDRLRDEPADDAGEALALLWRLAADERGAA